MSLKEKLLSFSRIGDKRLSERIKGSLQKKLDKVNLPKRQSIERQIEILDLIGSSNRHMNLNDVALELDISKATLREEMQQILELIKRK